MSEESIVHTKCPRCNKNRCSDRILQSDGSKKACWCRECSLEVFGETNNDFYKLRREINEGSVDA